MPIKDLLTTAANRISNPILGNYFLALFVLNWRLWILFFMGDETANWRIQTIEEYLVTAQFKLSFITALGIVCVYLYLIPFLITLMKTLQNKVDVYQLRKELSFEARLNNEKSLGGNAEVLANNLKKDLKEMTEHLKFYDEYVFNNLQVRNPGFQGGFNDLRSKSGRIVKDAEEHLSHLSDILNSVYGESHAALAKRFKDSRQRK